MFDLLSQLADPADRWFAAGRLASHLGATHLVYFVRDPELGSLLPAQGFPQSLPEGGRWRELVRDASVKREVQGRLQLEDAEWHAYAYGTEEGAVVVFLSDSQRPPDIERLPGATRVLTALFEQELCAQIAQAKVVQAERAANQAEALASGLDEARRRLQNILRELSHATREAEEASQAKSQFLANMSHEIRTPLHGVMGMIDLLGQSPLNEQQRRDIDVARTCCRSLLTIIEDVLDFSKIEARKIELESVNFDLEDVLRSVCAVHTKIALDKGIDFHCDFEFPSPWPVIGDPHRLSQILHNLLSNAIKFTAVGAVSCRCEATEAGEDWESTFLVKDSGVGIAAEVLPVLFEPFQQADASTTRRFGGSGLGLSISKQLAELMNGSIRVESTLGEGSTFTVQLPFVSGKLEEEAACLPVFGSMSLRILLAEDNPINRGVVSRMLLSRGHEVLEAADGEQAVEIWQAHSVDLILMDMHMPKLDGVEAIRRIRQQEQQCDRGHTMIVALTAATSVEDKRVCLQAGADEHLPKPLPANEFDKVLERARQRSRVVK